MCFSLFFSVKKKSIKGGAQVPLLFLKMPWGICLDFNKAQFLHPSAPAGPQGQVWSTFAGMWVPNQGTVGLGLCLFHGACPCPSSWLQTVQWDVNRCFSFQNHSRAIIPKKSRKGKRHERRGKKPKPTNQKNPRTPPKTLQTPTSFPLLHDFKRMV